MRSRPEGFTLIEVLVALAVLAAVSVALLRGLAASRRAQAAAENLMNAVAIAQDEITEAALAAAQKGKLEPGERSGVIHRSGREFTWASSVAAFGAAGLPDETRMSAAESAVAWKEPGRRPSLTAVRLFLNRG